MVISCAKEIKKHEYRVGMTPACAQAYVHAGHNVVIEKSAGEGAGYTDSEYKAAGAEICDTSKEAWERADMMVKVKEPQASEYPLMKEDLVLYTYLHLAADKEQTEALIARKVKSVAYETVEPDDGSLPLLRPMSAIAGRMSIQEGACFLERPRGGRGVLLGGVPGTEKGKVAILGGGIVGTEAAKMALGLGAQVTILDISLHRLSYLDDMFQGRITTLYSSTANRERVLSESDLVIGGVLVHGAKAPHLVTRSNLSNMKKGSVIVDVAVDQGGCAEMTRPTTHDDPIFVVDGVTHYCVANMPGGVSRTSTQALTASTLQYGLAIANKGLEKAAKEDNAIAKGINTYGGTLVYEAVAKAHGLQWKPITQFL